MNKLLLNLSLVIFIKIIEYLQLLIGERYYQLLL